MSKTIEWDESGSEVASVLSVPREEVFDRHYFDGGAKWGGYAHEGYRDFPCHHITAKHILDRNPKSVLEIGAARNYIVKRLQDHGIRAVGMEISHHCWLTRAADPLVKHDICNVPWPFENQSFDLVTSQATLEHIPENLLPSVIKEMCRVAKTGLHGIDFGEHDDGFDLSHCTLRDKSWWVKMFRQHAPNWFVEVLNKEEFESGSLPPEVMASDGLCKVEIGCFTIQNHYNWINLDIYDLNQFAQVNGYRFQQCDVRHGLPFATGSVHAIHASHVLEHFTYQDGLSLLRECRRVIHPEGVIRIAVPDMGKLACIYTSDVYTKNNHPNHMSDFDEMSNGAAACPTSAGKFWELIFPGHLAGYDELTLCFYLKEAGFKSLPTSFRKTNAGERGKIILRETIDSFPEMSIFCDVVPIISQEFNSNEWSRMG